MSSTQSLDLLFGFLERSYATVETNFYKIPGSSVVARYVRSSHQNDPGRTLLEVILIVFAIRTLLQSRTRGDQSGKHFIKFDEKVSIFRPSLGRRAHPVASSPGNRRPCGRMDPRTSRSASHPGGAG